VRSSGRDTVGTHFDVQVDRVNGPVYEWRTELTTGIPKVRTIWRVSGPGIRADYGVHNNNYPNVRRGLYERVLYRVGGEAALFPPTAAAGVFEERLAGVRDQLAGVCGSVRRVTRQEFVEMYTGRKRTIYENATASLAARQLTRADSFMSTFVKCEKIDFSAKPDPAPRVIQPRSPRYNVEVGRSLKQMEGRICEGVAEVWGGPTILKGRNAKGVAEGLRGMWDQFADPVAVDLDATRFDQHVSVAALEWEHSVYLALSDPKDRPTLARLLAWQLRNRGYARTADGTVVYEVAGRRMSGDMNTGMGNCLLMCCMIYAYARHVGVKCRLGNNGDDCVVVMERRDAKRFVASLEKYFLDFGFVMEVGKVVDTFEEVCYCQTQPVWGPDGWVMIRDPRKSIDKDLVSVLDLGTPTSGRKWAHAVGSCGLAMTGGTPLQEFYLLLQRSGQRGNVGEHPWMDGGFQRLSAGMQMSEGDVSPETRASFWRAFGILPDTQVAMEEVWAGMSLTFSAGEIANQLSLLRLTFE